MSAYESSLNLARVSDGTPYDWFIVEYVNPLTGASVMPTAEGLASIFRE